MAAGQAPFLTRPATSSFTSNPPSRFCPSTSSENLVKRVRLPVVRSPCAALAVSPAIVKEEFALSVPHIQDSLAWSLQKLEIGEDKNSLDVSDSSRSKPESRSPWDLLRNEAGSQADVTSKLPWMDPSLRYANVMWFKGAYNAQIFVSPNESEESIVRRFRHAVAEAGVLRECYRRRYRETPQDVIKRKQKQAALNRKRRPRYDNNSANTWKLQKEPSGSGKKTKKKKDYRSRSGSETGKKTTAEKDAHDSDDDDFWGYTEEADQW
ncbi:small subunit ribosomal protein S21 [Marchantia polymorpha subsp. ruderalis]|uniref:Uncharacterized protein n=2 Tax=Marchantia polymorpha TaxID=3197 RepID=A0A176VS81_MARPO|nr:hypothetical protein AXG93_745s1050 [Marchantia polymorpha subsp. ruderalis]PTQ36148.1 hypothetical protein MARPO_0066s0099 [Marchantia polymorpha]BBN07036.1 hypothetical protein Mp_4g00420 [Marchantia polymorpha subsp. ruderalis]|eukprot:PTQ36148.1 hypothetical protein MARPO_0066s0099 [Marchantia polymorpha]